MFTEDNYMFCPKCKNSSFQYRPASHSLICSGCGAELMLNEFGIKESAGDLMQRSIIGHPLFHPRTLAAGRYHTVAIREDGSCVWCGDNSYGQTSLADWNNIVSVACGYNHTLGLSEEGKVVAAGSNQYGELETSCWDHVVDIAGGMFHSVALHENGTVSAVGNNEKGQCDTDTWDHIIQVEAGKDFTVGLRSNGTVTATGGEIRDLDVKDWTDIKAISAGYHFVLGIRYNGSVLAAGQGETIIDFEKSNENALFTAENWRKIRKVSVGAVHTVGVCENNSVVAAGMNLQQSDVKELKNVVDAKAGMLHTAFLFSDGKVAALGNNSHGQCDVAAWGSVRVPGQLTHNSDENNEGW